MTLIVNLPGYIRKHLTQEIADECCKAIIEAIPDEKESMMIWLDDFNFPKDETEDMKEEIEKYFAENEL